MQTEKPIKYYTLFASSPQKVCYPNTISSFRGFDYILKISTKNLYMAKYKKIQSPKSVS